MHALLVCTTINHVFNAAAASYSERHAQGIAATPVP